MTSTCKKCKHKIEVELIIDEHDIHIADTIHCHDNQITMTHDEGRYILQELKKLYETN